ncbi:hypothetical protein F8388_004517 [Cannabis sativa]|uniref:Small ribosomal subunit protein uS7 domain-containing protein n=1 Tax=Cannabis sativa TaxID=3483 RepID=A0A7J6EQT6_CANSA|nr:hypothetical protein F8388_004517 [Cannabis sativa]
MSRRGSAEEKTAKSDPLYRNRLVNMLVNPYQIIYQAMKKIQQKTETNPLFVLRQAIRGVTPDIAVKTRRVGGSTHQWMLPKGVAMPYPNRKRLIEWQRKVELLHIFINP